MDKVIARATHIINQELQSNTCNLLQQLLKFDSPKNNWIRLFDRQLERLLNQDPHQDLTTIGNALQASRWLVILGDPDSAKTTLLRWITRIFAEAAYDEDKQIVLGEERVHCSIHISILIRIGEFAEWHVQHQTKILIDYIGEHTWFSECYCHDEDENVLKELIYHGHALILLDRLDEIPEVGQRKEIIELVRKFIDQYVRTPDFISPFDERMFSTRISWHYGVMKMQPPNAGGNQIMITSRIVGY
ncbi:unnamed protein product [Rotaria sp. Silwood1]|nr:unnamed protein product [Rotaria sp. Silwood1]